MTLEGTVLGPVGAAGCVGVGTTPVVTGTGAGFGVGVKGGEACASCWVTVGASWGGSDRLVAALSRGAPTMCCGWKPMLARCRSTAAMVTAVMVSRVSSGGPEVGGGCRGVKWVPDLEECDVWVRHLAIRGGKGVISLSVDCTA